MRDMLLMLCGGFAALFIELAASRLLYWFLRPRKIRRITLMPLYSDAADLEARLRWELFCLDNEGDRGEKLLAAIDMGLSADERKIAENMLKDRANAFLCGREKLRYLITDDKVYKELEFVLYYN